MKKWLKKFLENMFDSKFTIYDSLEEYENIKQEKLANKSKFNKGMEISVKVINLILIFIAGYILFGCSAKTEIVYKPVHIPVKCEVEIPSRPKSTQDVVIDNINLIKYTEKVENTLLFCVK